MDETEIEVAVVEKPEYLEPPEDDKLCIQWGKKIRDALKKQEKFRKHVRYVRDVVSGFDWKKDPKSDEMLRHRANLIHGTITGMLPNLYAKNPEITVSQISGQKTHRLFCQTLEKVLNRYLDAAGLKKQAKSAVRAAMTCSYGVVKVMYYAGQPSPLIAKRIDDIQDNLALLDEQARLINDPTKYQEQEAEKQKLEQALAALQEKAEITLDDGLVIDRVMTENILIDPSIVEFDDYANAAWMAQVIPMRVEDARKLFGYRLDGVSEYSDDDGESDISRMFRDSVSGKSISPEDGKKVCVYEIWDKDTQRVYTMVDGMKFWVREPYTPSNTGKRWYPFFLLPYQIVDGKFIGPSIFDLTKKLQDEHNDARDKLVEHRRLIRPGYIAAAQVKEQDIKRFTDSLMGEVVIIDSEGQPINQIIQPKSYPPIDPSAYDTSSVRTDWEMVTGMQDAARSTVVKPKTATEAQIMQQSLSARVSEFRDQIEDYLQQIAQYTAEILLQTLTENDVANVMGQHETAIDPATGMPYIAKAAYEWQTIPKEQVFDLLEIKIRAGTTGAPDKQEQQEKWLQFLQVIQPMIAQIMQVQMQGLEPTAQINLLKETITRFDDRLEVEDFVPNMLEQVQQRQAAQQQMMMQQPQ